MQEIIDISDEVDLGTTKVIGVPETDSDSIIAAFERDLAQSGLLNYKD